jgi:hypothetical protein
MLARASKEQLHAIILLTLFHGSFTCEAAAKVVGKDKRVLEGFLQVLHQMALLEASNGDTRFSLHPLVREVAASMQVRYV